MTTRKFGHRWYRQISLKEIEAADVIHFFGSNGRHYWRKVKSVTRKGRVRTEAVEYKGAVAVRSKNVSPADIISAWAKGLPA